MKTNHQGKCGMGLIGACFMIGVSVFATPSAFAETTEAERPSFERSLVGYYSAMTHALSDSEADSQGGTPRFTGVDHGARIQTAAWAGAWVSVPFSTYTASWLTGVFANLGLSPLTTTVAFDGGVIFATTGTAYLLTEWIGEMTYSILDQAARSRVRSVLLFGKPELHGFTGFSEFQSRAIPAWAINRMDALAEAERLQQWVDRTGIKNTYDDPRYMRPVLRALKRFGLKRIFAVSDEAELQEIGARVLKQLEKMQMNGVNQSAEVFAAHEALGRLLSEKFISRTFPNNQPDWLIRRWIPFLELGERWGESLGVDFLPKNWEKRVVERASEWKVRLIQAVTHLGCEAPLIGE